MLGNTSRALFVPPVHTLVDDIFDINDALFQMPRARLNTWYEFIGCYLNLGRYMAAYAHPPSTHCFLRPHSLHQLMLHGHDHFTVVNVKAILDFHNVPYAIHDIKAKLLSHLLKHHCSEACQNVLYTFSCRYRPRNKPQPIIQPTQSSIDAAAAEHSSTSASSRRVVYERNRLNSQKEYADEIASAASNLYTNVNSFDEKKIFIEEWESIYKTAKFPSHVCAVCGERKVPASPDFAWTEHRKIDFSLCNPELPHSRLPTTYNLNAYDRALLNPKGLRDTNTKSDILLCAPCHHDLMRSPPVMPKLAIANWFYYGYDRLPPQILQDFQSSTIFERMLVSRCSSSKIVHRFSDNKNSTVYGDPSITSQKYCQGNTVVLPQASVTLNRCLPPPPEVVQDTFCALFIGREEPTKENIQRLRPILARKSRVERMIKFLVVGNPHYQADRDFDGFSAENLERLIPASDKDVPHGIEISFLPSTTAMDSLTSDYTDRNEPDPESTNRSSVLMENVGYTEGEYSSSNYQKMKHLYTAKVASPRGEMGRPSGLDEQ